MSQITLALDYSTSCTGYALFEGEVLVKWGTIKSRSLKEFKGYPFGTLRKLEHVADMLKELIDSYNPDIIVVEEINKGTARLTQKTLDAGHYILLQKIKNYEGRFYYIDTSFWRNALNLKMTDEHKKAPKEIRRKLPAQEFVNKKFKTNFNVIENKSDADVCDSIGLGYAFVTQVLTLDK